jgi:hypothetical protein
MMTAIAMTRPDTPLGKKPQVGHGRFGTGIAGDQQVAAVDDHADHRHHLDDGEPEFHFAVGAHIGQADGIDDQEEGEGAGPGRDARPPVLDVDADRRQFGHADQHIQYPVVPARHEAGHVAAVFVGEVAEGARHRFIDHHLAQLAHDQERDHAGNGIPEQHGGPGQLDGFRDTHEKARADRPAQRNQLDMAAFQAPFQFCHVWNPGVEMVEGTDSTSSQGNNVISALPQFESGFLDLDQVFCRRPWICCKYAHT